MWEALEQTAWVKTLGSTGWMYSTVAVTHYLTMFWCIGSIAVVDLRVMGIAARRRGLGELAEQLFPWAWIGFAFALLSGFLMFATDAGDWAPSRVFHWKLALIATSAIVAGVVQWLAPRLTGRSEIPTWAKLVALLSLLLWIVTILSASEIPALEGLG
jgi:hypothetical protein